MSTKPGAIQLVTVTLTREEAREMERMKEQSGAYQFVESRGGTPARYSEYHLISETKNKGLMTLR
ncbi:hypothetical protein D3C87_2012140 [compost metagenome]